MKQKKKKEKSLQNNFYAWKLLWSMSPKMCIHLSLVQFLGYVEWLFYSGVFMRFVIDAMKNETKAESIFLFLGITVVCFAAMSLYTCYVQGKMMPEETAKIYGKLNLKLFDKATSVDLSCFEDSEFYNRYTLASEMATDRLIQTVDNFAGTVSGLVAALAAFGLMFEVDKISVLFIIFPIIGNFVFNRKLSAIDYKRNKDMAPHNRTVAYVNRVMYLSDYAKEIRLTDAFRMMKKKYREAIDGMVDVTKKYTVKSMILHWFYVMFTFSFIFEGLLIYGAFRSIVTKSMSLAQLSVLTSLMVSTTWILIGFTDSLIATVKNGLYMNNLRGFLEYIPEIPEDCDGDDPGNEIHSVEFRDVCFSYKGKEVISHLSFEIRGQKTYALVGHNGAGKSTIIKLLMRFYDPASGAIYLNGRDIREYNLQKYRALFAGAFQDYQIFSLSVAENVLMHKEEAGDEEIVTEALKMAGIYDKVMTLPKGIHTTLTKEFDPEGVVLSGGEFQKIVVARAFARNCQVKIFDEPSSALDPIAEYRLFDSILKDGKGKTMLFISHRLSSVQNADWVMMLENGKLIEQGTHKSLMEKHGAYADMYEKQAINYLAAENFEERRGIFA